MKNLIQNISVCLFCMIAFSCSNNFLKDGQDLSTTTVGTELFILPESDAADYAINVPSAGNAKFTIVQTPDWLHVNSTSGQFVNDYASVNCSASTRSDYSAPGFYNASLVLNIEGIGKVLVPVTYLTEGNPAIQTATDLTIRNDSAYFVSLSVGNKGDGILLWKIIEKPEWITIYFNFGTALPDSVVYPLPQNIGFDFKLYYDINNIPFNDQNGKIVIVSNDKNNSTTVINIPSNIGTPSLYCSWDQFDFGSTDTSLALFIYNIGDGFLNWKIDSSLPKWLTASKTNDVLTPYNSQQIMLTCNRSLLPAGQQTLTIYLKTNDKNNPSYPITVTATGQ